MQGASSPVKQCSKTCWWPTKSYVASPQKVEITTRVIMYVKNYVCRRTCALNCPDFFISMRQGKKLSPLPTLSPGRLVIRTGYHSCPRSIECSRRRRAHIHIYVGATRASRHGRGGERRESKLGRNVYCSAELALAPLPVVRDPPTQLPKVQAVHVQDVSKHTTFLTCSVVLVRREVYSN